MLRVIPVESAIRAVPVQSSLTVYVPVRDLLTGDALAEKSVTVRLKRPRYFFLPLL